MNEGYLEKNIEEMKSKLLVLAGQKGYEVSDDRFLNGSYTVRLTKTGAMEIAGEGSTLYQAYENAFSLLSEQ